MNMSCWRKRIVALSMVGVISMGGITVAEAAPWDAVVQGAAAMIYVKKEIRRMDDEDQKDLLAKMEARTGYYDNPAYQYRAEELVNNLEQQNHLKRKYAVYVNPDTSVNAFMSLGGVMSINKGTMDLLNNDELAYVVGHELAHGENRDIVHGVEKSVGLSTAINIATAGAGGGSVLIGNIAGNYIENEMFTMGQEKKADEDGFTYLVGAGYNPGAAAAAMAILRTSSGDHYSEGLASVINPNNHPKTSNRVKENVARMMKYSNNHVNVENNTVYVNKKAIYEPPATGSMTGELRSYYMAGKLAMLYHDNNIAKDKVNVNSSTVYVGDTSIVTTSSNEEANTVATALKGAIEK